MSVLNTSLDTTELPKGCGCSACMQAANYGVSTLENDPVNDSALDAPSITATNDQFADYLINGFWSDFGSIGRSWADTNITFSLSNSYSAAQKEGFRMAFESWSDVANLNFTEVSSGGDMNIVVGNDGRAYSSSGVYSNGDIAYNTISIDTSPWYWQNFNELGDYALITAIHEIGHSLGLGHTGNYNGSATYGTDAQFTNDSRQYSVMSYFNASETGANHQGEYASTPMLMDIYAVQQIYGANFSIRSGDTTYGFNADAGRDQYDFTINTVPVVAIWDGAGNDTIDLSGWSNTQTINLNAGTFSDVGGGTGNLSIAYGALIENAIGGSGVDTIYGNAVANIINGNAGDDHLYGSSGNDTIDGGDGSDTLYYALGFSDFNISIVNSTTVELESISGEFTDTVSNIETYSFNGVTYTHSQIMDTLSVSAVQVMFGDSSSVQYRKVYNATPGTTNYTGDDLGFAGINTAWGVVDHSGTSMTVTNRNVSGNQLDYARIVDSNLTSATLDGFDTSVISLKNATATSATVTNTTNGVIYTSGGNDTISVSILASAVNGDVFDIHSGDGNDGVTVNNSSGGATRVYAGAGNDTILNNGSGAMIAYGQAGIDILTGGSNNDQLYGGSESDTVNGNAGADILYGDGGDDTINGGDGNDFISGGTGIDTINGGNDHDTIYAGSENDIVNGGDGNDFINGEDGDDDLDGGSGNDIIYGGYGADNILGMLGADRLYGQDGIDTIYGGDGGDKIYGGNDGDILYGEAGADVIAGEAGNDTVYGGDDGDIIYGQSGDDILHGEAGNDSLDGGLGLDTIYGGDGADSITGRDGNDILFGDDGNDYIYGGNDNDYVRGGTGTDRLYGEAGNDILIGNGERDILYGGAHADVFALSDIAVTYDRFADLNLVEGDSINITDVLTGYIDGVDDINDFVSFIDQGSYTNMMISENGDGNYVRGAQIFGNALDGLSVDDLIAQNDLVVNSSII